MRTNIVLDEQLVQEAMRHSHARTKRALVDEALRTLVQVRTETKRRESCRERMLLLDLRLDGLKLKKPPHALLREDRNRK